MALIQISVKPRQEDRDRFGAELALADISVLDSNESQLGRRVKNDLIIPVSGAAVPAQIDLAVGRYLISIAMPSGEQFVQRLDVLSDTPINLVLSGIEGADGAPRSRQVTTRLQPTRRASSVEANNAVPRRVRTTDGAYLAHSNSQEIELAKPVSLLSVGRRTPAPQRVPVRLSERAPAPSQVPSMVDLPGARLGLRSPFTDETGPVDIEDWLDQLTAGGDQLPKFQRESLGQDIFRFEVPSLPHPSMAPDFAGDLWRSGSPTRVNQRYVGSFLPDGRVKSLAVVPWLWSAHEERPVKCAINVYEEWNGSKSEWSMRVVVKDGHMASVLGHLTRGNLRGAQSLLKDSLHMLMAKIKNPYAAAAGGYVLIYSKNEDISEPEWPAWIRNFATWYPSSPDAQILLATLCLQRRRLLHRANLSLENDDRQRLRLARVLLERALKAGLPMYSLGMRLLTENLEILLEEQTTMGLLAKADDLRMRETLRRVRTVSSCMTTVQPMTVLSFSDLWRSLKPRPSTNG